MKFGRGEMVNKSRCCGALGLSRPTFDRYVAKGMPVVERPIDKGGEYKVYLGEVASWLAKNAAQDATVADDALDLNAERARLAKEQADKLERERLLDERRLLAAEVVREALIRCFSSVNGKIGALPSKLAHILRPDDPHTARRHLELAVEEMRAELRAIDVAGVEGWEDDARH